jgi:AICAR transformylase/IMP cyclohydrolase PurH
MQMNSPLLTLTPGELLQINARLVSLCKYGENPHQTPAGLFAFDTDDQLAIHKFEVAHEAMTPSFITITDLDSLVKTATYAAAGFEVNDFDVPRMSFGVKHGNCSGGSEKDTSESESEIAAASVGSSQTSCIEHMMKGSLKSIFGGVVLTNFHITADDAIGLALTKLDGVIAPRFEPEVFEKLERAHGKCRFLKNPALFQLGIHSLNTAPQIRQVRGGCLVQPSSPYVIKFASPDMKVYGAPLTTGQKRDLILAWAIGSTSTSNTITIVKDGQLLGNGVGQQDRVTAAKLALLRADMAEHWVLGAVAYSDSFFPFPDGVEVLIKAGIKVIFASSGSQNDHLTIELCHRHGVTLVMVPDKICRGFARH